MATDDNPSMKQTEQVSKISPVHNAPASHVWQEAYEGTKSCRPSQEYQTFINRALSESYSPELFGDPKKIENEFDCQIHNLNDAIKYANKVLGRSGDPHTGVLPPSDNKAFAAMTNPDATGFGMDTTFDASNSSPGNDHGLAVFRAYADSPAAKAGLKAGDKILSVDAQGVSRLSFDDADAALQGPAGSIAHLLVDRNGELVQVEARRQEYKKPSVSDVSLQDNLAYISIGDFRNEHVPEQLRDALLRHKDAKGFVIDLRGNSGGQVNLANRALSEVMKDGEIMKIRERNTADTEHVSYLSGSYQLTPNGIVLSESAESKTTYQIGNSKEFVTFDLDSKPKREVTPRMPNLVGNRPVVILTNGGTASAAEIFTGAEHDTGGARTFGLTSLGKGIGGLYSDKLVGDAGEVVTNMRYFTPSGVWPGDAAKHKYGLKPDVEVHNPYGAIPTMPEDAQLIAAESDLRNTLNKRN